MTAREAQYRLKIAHGFLEESQQDIVTKRWRSAVDNAQLATENAAKAVLALVAPLGKTHNPALLLRKSLRDQLFSEKYRPMIDQLANLSDSLGYDIHVQTDYGDELEGLTPWEIFGEDDAQQSVKIAEEALNLTVKLIGGLLEN